MSERDWHAWHAEYDQPGSRLAQRLIAVQTQIRAALDAAAPGPLRLISLCAGQGRDVIGVLAEHPRRGDVTARLVELDPRNAWVARELAAQHGLDRVEVIVGDAALIDHYAALAPADLVIACGIFGNITDADVARTIGFTTQLCAEGGTVVWTRGRREPDLVPQVCAWFAEHGFDQVWVSDPGTSFAVGAHRFTGTPAPLEAGATLFTFVGFDRLDGGAR
ncbi:class I SAM-dependent methyltransferase family protein [Nocardia sp. alder85J]|uniref:class I SAM-dependent methyltransferase family protein n=1 Tax=Nocardia sp. alder85J TaxID=2862949 RepID=UPI001CD80443|nr:class I SAM-dependent methyltransferase family protein [Nocardia sp. alder85J]MCX4090908.1 class I SAM-dependent methyltransferase family protein [Nocardia sp. alder85J]